MNNMSKVLVGAAVAALVGAVTISTPAMANKEKTTKEKKGCSGKNGCGKDHKDHAKDGKDGHSCDKGGEEHKK